LQFPGNIRDYPQELFSRGTENRGGADGDEPGGGSQRFAAAGVRARRERALVTVVWLVVAAVVAVVVVAALIVTRRQKLRQSDEQDQRALNLQVIAVELDEVVTALVVKFQDAAATQALRTPEQMLQAGTLGERQRDTLHVAHAQSHLFDDAQRERIILVVRLLRALQEHAEKSRDTWARAPAGMELAAYREQRCDSFDKSVSVLIGHLKGVQANLAAHLPDYLIILAWNFAPEILAKVKPLTEQGMKCIVPLPELKVI